MNGRKKILRYHRRIFFPSNTSELLEEFLDSLRKEFPLVFSVHAVDNAIIYEKRHGKKVWEFIQNIIRKRDFRKENIFEFYINREKGVITKACFRFSDRKFPVDVVIVVSRDATIISLFTVGKTDEHTTMNESLYERS